MEIRKGKELVPGLTYSTVESSKLSKLETKYTEMMTISVFVASLNDLFLSFITSCPIVSSVIRDRSC